jgi:NAD(P) transhydrogenase subunit beta
MVIAPGYFWLWAIIGIALVAGVTMVIPIGGADMPVVIALLNSFSGLAASAAGFVFGNQIMCKAMNRTLFNVLFGSIEASGEVADADEIYDGKVTSSSADEVAIILETAQRVAIVPGYGMAVAQAQHAVRDLTRSLEEQGIEVVFAIHPVAGRMPGHMNVLLAEAEIPYEQLLEMERVNPTFDQTDVVIVIGANDVVNPEARENPDSPIAGMPILDADMARTVVVIKRSLSPGFAGIPNPLFAADNTLMLFGDGKAEVENITKALAEV